MVLVRERLVQEVVELVRLRYVELGRALGVGSGQEGVDTVGELGLLQDDLRLLIGVANGEYGRTDELVSEVEQALVRLMDLLLGNVLRGRVLIPDDFWKSDIGVMVSRVRWWISVDELITISNAAALAFGENTQASRMRIVRAMDNGWLEWVPDPSVANPQQNKRVLRSQVERLYEQL